MPVIQKSTVFEAKTVTTTSPWIDVADAESLSLSIKAASIASGNGVFVLQGTIVDGTPAAADIHDLMLIDNLSNTNTQTPTRVVSKTLSSNVGAILFLDGFVAKALKRVRVTVTVTTDGSYSAYLFAKRQAN